MPQRRWCALAQPQCSMKESLPDIVLLLEVDRTATVGSASNESRSLQLLLVLHTLVGGAELRRTTEGSRTTPGCCAAPRADYAVHTHVYGVCTAEVLGRGSQNPSVGAFPRGATFMLKLSSAPFTTLHRDRY